MTTDQALVKTTVANGNGLVAVSPQAPKPTAPAQPLTEEMVDQLLSGRGFRGWLRAARVARVLGLFSLYLFLDTYDVRADFNRRGVARSRDLAREKGRAAQFKAWINSQLHTALDRFIRVLRYMVFRGAEGSARKHLGARSSSCQVEQRTSVPRS